MILYQELGVRPLVNAAGAESAIGGSALSGSVLNAIREAAEQFVPLDVLREAVSRRLATTLDAEAACIVSGAQAGLMLVTAALIAGNDRYRLHRLPDATGLRHNFHLPGEGVPHAPILCAGGKIRQEDAIATVMTDSDARETSRPLIVYQTRELPAPDELRRLSHMSSAVIIPGANVLGPMQSALVLCTQPLYETLSLLVAPCHGLGRSYKIGKEEIAGLYRAMTEYKAARSEALTRCERLATHLCQSISGAELIHMNGYACVELDDPGELDGIRTRRLPGGRILLSPLYLDEEKAAFTAQAITTARQVASSHTSKSR